MQATYYEIREFLIWKMRDKLGHKIQISFCFAVYKFIWNITCLLFEWNID